MKRRIFLTLLAATVSERALAQATVVSSCGSVTLTAGTPHNVTIDGNGQSCQSGASGGAPTSVWSASDAAANGMTLSNGGLTVASSVSSFLSVRSSISKTSGKLYIEFLTSIGGLAAQLWGLADAGFTSGTFLGNAPISCGAQGSGANYERGGGFVSNYVIPSAVTPGVNDVWALAVDFGAGSIWLAQNNVWFGGSNPATGSLPMFSFTPASAGALFPAITLYGATSWTLQSTAASQKYAPPSGFTPWG